MNLDLKNFKRIGGDKQTTTLQHPKGHQIVVKHSALPAAMKKQLESLPMHAAPAESPTATKDAQKGAKPVKPPKATAMADGGGIPGGPGSPAIDPEKAKAMQKGVGPASNPDPKSASDAWSNLKSGLGLAKGGPVGPMNPKLAESKKCPHCGHGDTMEQPTEASAYDAGGKVADPTANLPPAQADDPEHTDVQLPGGGNAYAQSAGVDPGTGGTEPFEVPSDPTGAAYATSYNDQKAHPLQPRTADIPVPDATPPAPQEKAPDTTPPVDTTNPMAKGSNTAIKGMQAEQGANSALATIADKQAKANQDYLDQAAAAQQENAGILRTAGEHFNQVHQATVDAINAGQIKPKDYIDKMSTGGKISTGIGLILGGMGQGLMRSKSNPALDFLNSQIDRNIEAQKANLGSQENLLSANMKQYQDVQTAVEATRMQETAIVQAHMNAMAGQYGGQIAAQNAIAANGAIDGKIGEMQNHLAMYQMLSQAQNSGDPVRAVQGLRAVGAMGMPGGEEMAKNLESKLVPGAGPNGSIGKATQPVPQEVRDKIVAGQTTESAIKDLQDFVNSHGITVNKWGADYSAGILKAQAVQQAIRQTQMGGIYRAGEQPLIDKMINDNPTGFIGHFTSNPKLQELMMENTRHLNGLKAGVGIPVVAPPKSLKEGKPGIGK